MRGSYVCKYISTTLIYDVHYTIPSYADFEMMIKTMLIQICILVILVENQPEILF